METRVVQVGQSYELKDGGRWKVIDRRGRGRNSAVQCHGCGPGETLHAQWFSTKRFAQRIAAILQRKWRIRVSVELSVKGAGSEAEAVEAAKEWLKGAGKHGDSVMLANIEDAMALSSESHWAGN